MDKTQKATLVLAVAVTLFVLVTAAYTGNGALYLLGGLACISGLLTWQQNRSGT